MFPTGWALQKPDQTIDPATFQRMHAAGELLLNHKYNGHRLHIVTAGASTRLYSRNGAVDKTALLPHLVAQYASAPHGLIIDGEAHVEAEGTSAYQAAENNNPEDVLFTAFDLIDLAQKHVDLGYAYRLAKLHRVQEMTGGRVAQAADLKPGASYEEALRYIEAMGIEGIVAWKREAGHNLNFSGNTKRGRSFKIKLRATEDLIVTRVNGCADPDQGCGSLEIARMIGPGLPLQPLGKVGSFEKDFDRIAALQLQTPFIVEVLHYGEDGNGKLEFAKVSRLRPDKHQEMGLAA